MSINTNVHLVKEDYIVGYEDVYKDVEKSKEICIEGIPYNYSKTYELPNDIVIQINDLMQNKKIEYYLWRYCNFFQTILKIDNLKKNLDYEHICFCFDDLPHNESILINNIWRLGKEWSHTIVCCKTNYPFIRSFVGQNNANIRIIKLDCDVVFIHEINDYLLNENFLNKFHGKYLFFSNNSSLITSNIEITDFDNIYYANANKGNIANLQDFYFYNKEKLTQQLKNIDIKNEEYSITPEYLKNKEDYCLEKIPANMFYNSVLESQYINIEYNKTIHMFNFSDSDDNVNKEEIFTKVLKYLEELLNIYY